VTILIHYILSLWLRKAIVSLMASAGIVSVTLQEATCDPLKILSMLSLCLLAFMHFLLLAHQRKITTVCFNVCIGENVEKKSH